MKSLGLLVAVGALLCAPVLAQIVLGSNYDNARSAYELCNQSDQYINSNSYGQARDLLIRAAQYDPTRYSAYVHLKLAQCYRNLKDYTPAIAEAKAACKFDPNAANPYYTLALIYNDLDRSRDAADCLNKYIAMTGDAEERRRATELANDFMFYSNCKRAHACIKNKDWHEAKRLLTLAVGSKPAAPHAHANLAYVLKHLGDLEGAVAEGKKACALDPSDKDSMYSLAVDYEELCKFDEATKWAQVYLSKETDAARRKGAADFLNMLEEDKENWSHANNKSSDYLGVADQYGKQAKWAPERMPIKVYIASGKGVFGYRPVFNSYIKRGFDAWCIASGKKIDYKIVDDEKNADITVVWRSDAYADKKSSLPTCGQTSPTFAKAGVFDRAQISVLTVDSFNTSEPVSDRVCASTCLHEIGHALGLLPHSKMITDEMYYRQSSRQTGDLSKRDQTTIAKLYFDYPVLAVVAKAPVIQVISADKYLPPPVFMPPKAPDTKNLLPPMFLPPPLQKEREALMPPLFTPPPIKNGSDQPKDKKPALPMFTPPALPSAGSKPNAKSGTVVPPMFMPPPVKKSN